MSSIQHSRNIPQNRGTSKSIAKDPNLNSTPRLKKDTADGGKVFESGNLRWYYIVLIVLSVTFYAGTIGNGYVMDDLEVLQKNAFVTQGIKGIPALLSTPHLAGFMTAPNETYRPLSLVCFALEYQFAGANPAVNHFFNVVFFSLCVTFFFLFLNRLMGEKRIWTAFIAASLFAMHPVHSEVVANIKSRDELMCFFFAFLALLQWINYIKNGRVASFVTGTIALLLAYLSKETVVSFVLLIPLIFYCFVPVHKTRTIAILAATLGVTLLYLSLRYWVLWTAHNQSVPVSALDNFIVAAPGFSARIATAFLVLERYLRLSILPYPLLCDYSACSIPVATGFTARVWVTAVVYLAMVLWSVLRLRENRRDFWAMGMLFYVLTLLVFSNLFFLIGSGMSERFLFFPTTGICLLLALLAERWITGRGSTTVAILSKPLFWLVFLPVILGSAKYTSARNAEWKDNYTLYSSDAAKAPDNARLQYCVGYELVANGKELLATGAVEHNPLADGIEHLRRACSLQPGYVSAETELGSAFFMAGQYDSALAYNILAYKNSPNDPVIHNTIAGVYFVKKQYVVALEYCKSALALSPHYTVALKNEGLCFYNMQRYDSALVYFQMARKESDTYPELYGLMANAWNSLGNQDSAKKYSVLAQHKN